MLLMYVVDRIHAHGGHWCPEGEVFSGDISRSALPSLLLLPASQTEGSPHEEKEKETNPLEDDVEDHPAGEGEEDEEGEGDDLQARQFRTFYFPWLSSFLSYPLC